MPRDPAPFRWLDGDDPAAAAPAQGSGADDFTYVSPVKEERPSRRQAVQRRTAAAAGGAGAAAAAAWQRAGSAPAPAASQAAAASAAAPAAATVATAWAVGMAREVVDAASGTVADTLQPAAALVWEVVLPVGAALLGAAAWLLRLLWGVTGGRLLGKPPGAAGLPGGPAPGAAHATGNACRPLGSAQLPLAAWGRGRPCDCVAAMQAALASLGVPAMGAGALSSACSQLARPGLGTGSGAALVEVHDEVMAGALSALPCWLPGGRRQCEAWLGVVRALGALRHPHLLLFMGAAVGLVEGRPAACLVFEPLTGSRDLEGALAAPAGAPGCSRPHAVQRVAAAAGGGGAAGRAAPPAAALTWGERAQLAQQLASVGSLLAARGVQLPCGAAAWNEAALVAGQPGSGGGGAQLRVHMAHWLLQAAGLMGSSSGSGGAQWHAPATGRAPPTSRVWWGGRAPAVHQGPGAAPAGGGGGGLVAPAGAAACGHLMLMLLTGPPLPCQPDVAALREMQAQPGGAAGLADPVPGPCPPQLAQRLLEAALLCLQCESAGGTHGRGAAGGWLQWLRWLQAGGAAGGAASGQGGGGGGAHAAQASSAVAGPVFSWRQVGELTAAAAGEAGQQLLWQEQPGPSPQRASDQGGGSGLFICPLTLDVMRDPVVADDGHTYERAALAAWLAAGHRRSPLTRAPISTRLVPNHALRSSILDYQARSAGKGQQQPL